MHHKRLTAVSIVVIAVVWCMPALAAVMPSGCMCCMQQSCCCGCQDKTAPAEGGQASPQDTCSCTITGNSTTADAVAVYTAAAKLQAECPYMSAAGCSGPVPRTGKSTHNHNHSPPTVPALFLLKASLLL